MTTSRLVDLVAVQARVSVADYGSPAAYAARHGALADRVAAILAAAGPDPDGLTPPVLAVWPEDVGAFLGLQGHLEAVDGAATTDEALQRVGRRILPQVLGVMLRHRTRSTTRAFLTATAADAWRTHVGTFSNIAAAHGWWVVAGSALLPRNAYGDDALAFAPLRGAAGTQVFNTSHTFGPDGAVRAVTRKVNLVPTQEDVLDLSPGDPSALSVVDAEVGRLGTLICYDGFREAHTSDEPEWVGCAERLDGLGATVVAQPSANAWLWDAPWFFNDTDAGEQQLRREQWFSEGMASQLGGLRSVRYVVNPQLVGDVLDNHFEAPSLILRRTDEGHSEVLAESSDLHAEDVLHVRVAVPA